MIDDDTGFDRAARMRRRAEEIVCGKDALSPGDLEAMLPEEIQQIIQELQVHQVEMKMQNDELLRVQEELETVRARYFDLYNLAPVGYLVVSSEGLIAEINLTAASLLGLPRAALIKQPITRFIHRDDQDIYYHHRRQLYLLTRPHACELRMMKSDGTSFWTLLTATAVEEDSTASREASWDTRVSRVVLSDISDPKRLEEENLALEAKLKRALEAAHSD